MRQIVKTSNLRETERTTYNNELTLLDDPGTGVGSAGRLMKQHGGNLTFRSAAFACTVLMLPKNTIIINKQWLYHLFKWMNICIC